MKREPYERPLQAVLYAVISIAAQAIGFTTAAYAFFALALFVLCVDLIVNFFS